MHIIKFRPEHLEAWKKLNIAWISKDYVVEEIDLETLSFPENYFLKDGGAIFLAEIDGEIVGTVALQPFGNDTFELAKMTVKDGLRGLKIGEKLGIVCLEHAQKIGAKQVFLFSNTKAWQALNLYFKLGFRVCSLGESEFSRANIKMELALPSPSYAPILGENTPFLAIETAEKLRTTTAKIYKKLKKVTPDRAAQKRADGGWSPIQIVGHLIDSACNNHQKWVRAMQFSGSKMDGYDADFWVAASAYQSLDWQDLIKFWASYQQHLAEIIERTTAEDWVKTIEIVGYGRCTLSYLMTDYERHLAHHLGEKFWKSMKNWG
jgi:GNAT superfamily N-acetyltransferase